MRDWGLTAVNTSGAATSRARLVPFSAEVNPAAKYMLTHGLRLPMSQVSVVAESTRIGRGSKVPQEKIKLPKRSMKGAYDDEATLKGRKFVPEKY